MAGGGGVDRPPFSKTRPDDVKREITGYHRDEDGDWVAHLACGHQRHVRHDPPWMTRPWVTTPEGRGRALGRRIRCGTCETEGPPNTPVHDDPVDDNLLAGDAS
jgi:hypothetical protein